MEKKPMARIAEIRRTTGETDIRLRLDLDGSGKADIKTGIPFLDHMLNLFARHGFFDLEIDAKGDLEVDYHHTMEDLGIVLGQAIVKAAGDKKGIRRYGSFLLPMDEALAEIALDLVYCVIVNACLIKGECVEFKGTVRLVGNRFGNAVSVKSEREFLFVHFSARKQLFAKNIII